MMIICHAVTGSSSDKLSVCLSVSPCSHKRRDQFKQQLTKISNTLTRERSGRSRTRETPPISRPLPLPPGHESK